MLYVLLIAAVLYLIYTLFRSGKKTKAKESPVIPEKPQEKLAREMVDAILNSLKVEVSTTSSQTEATAGVIDVSGEGARLQSVVAPTVTKYLGVVPAWSHRYVYSHDELKYATNAQQEFYYAFKANFLKGIYFDVEGNTNYFFILFFDVLHSYDNGHKNLALLTSQLDSLVECYPHTQQYAKSELLKRLRAKGDEKGIARIYNSEIYQPPNQDYFSYGLGDRYKKQLKLSDDAVKQLNVLIDTSNKFNGIEYCALQLINMFLAVVKEVEATLRQNGTNLNEQIQAIAAIELTKHYRYKPGSYNYTTLDKVFINTIYQLIYKCCENKLRDHFSIGRKTDLSSYLHAPNAIAEYNTRLLPHIESAIDKAIQSLPKADLETEVAFNDYNKARWKTIVDCLEESFSPEDKKAYIDGIRELEKCNHKNPSIENIFFQASKFMAKHDKVESLKFYIHYLYYDLKSSEFDNKQLTKTIQKSLFQTNEQLHEFEKIISGLIHDKDLPKALKAVEQLYVPKRKKIKLNSAAIKEVHERHADTVDLLNEYLHDEFEDQTTSIKSEQSSDEEVKIEITQKTIETPKVDVPAAFSGLNPVQQELLDLFVKSSLTLSLSQLETFAKTKSAFKNQLIDSINEHYYEKLDDVLIEEEENAYTISENYYQRISVQ